MGQYKETLRGWIGKVTERLRGWMNTLGAWIKESMGETSPRRVVVLAVALSLWMGIGGMDSSEVVIKTEGEAFGELHWYPPEPPQGVEGDG